MYARFLSGPTVNGRLITFKAAMWHTKAASRREPPFFEDDFRIVRTAATVRALVTDPADGWPLLSDGSRAPAYTAADAPEPALIGQPYLPARKSYKRETMPTLDVDEIKAIIKRRYEREVAGREPATVQARLAAEASARQVHEEILSNDPTIGALADQEFTL